MGHPWTPKYLKPEKFGQKRCIASKTTYVYNIEIRVTLKVNELADYNNLSSISPPAIEFSRIGN